MYTLMTVLFAVLEFHIRNMQENQDISQLEILKEQLRNQMEQEADHNRLVWFIRICGLSDFEIFCLSMMLAAEMNQEYGDLFAHMQGGEERKPTKKLALLLYLRIYDMEESLQQQFLYEEGALGKYCMDGTGGDLLCLDKNIYQFLFYEKVSFIPRIEYAVFFAFEKSLPPLLIYRKAGEEIKRILQTGQKETLLIQLSGESGMGKHFLLKKVLEESQGDKSIIFFDLCSFLQENSKIPKNLLCKLKCYARLSGSVLCMELKEIPEEKGAAWLLREFLEKLLSTEGEYHPPAIFLITKEDVEMVLQDCKRVIKFAFPPLSIGEKAALWEEFGKSFPLEVEKGWEQETGKYILTASGIQNVLHTAVLCACAKGHEAIGLKELYAALKMRQPEQLGSYASPIDAVFTWEDLILEEKSQKMLRLICNQMKYGRQVGEEWGFYRKMPYGRGISALFYGPPGTGKTMAVQVMANELGLSLYRIDLSQMVSKYIGETEKNISDLFERAKSINAILFFDEADALFAKRSEIKDSNDRSANSMTAHLLQKLEDYEGITILATNLLHNMDDAFKRRIKYIVQFQFPDTEIRLKLFQSMLPEQAVCEESLDFNFFAKQFELSGSSIKEVLLNAAFMAAGEHTGIRNCHIVEAVKLNYLKYGKVLTRKDFAYLE